MTRKRVKKTPMAQIQAATKRDERPQKRAEKETLQGDVLENSSKLEKVSSSKTARARSRGQKAAMQPSVTEQITSQTRSQPTVPITAKPAGKPPKLPHPGPASSTRPHATASSNSPRPPRTAAAKHLKIPSILLEGDQPPTLSGSGPGARYQLGSQPVLHDVSSGARELPSAYGTGRVFLAARDPHWLYVSWDLTTEQQQAFNRQSADGHLILRVFADEESVSTVPDVHVNPESRDWFVHVPRASTRYRAELGYCDSRRNWHLVSASGSTFTPPEAPSPDLHADFATIPTDVTFQQVVQVVQEFAQKNEPLLEAVIRATQMIEESRERPNREAESPSPMAPKQNGSSPRASRSRTRISEASNPKREVPRIPVHIEPGKPWTPAQRSAITRLISVDTKRRVWMGSLEITELVRQQLQEEISSIAAAELSASSAGEEISGPGMSVSSPLGGIPQKHRKFWFKVNAELVIYGATEPDASVTVADRPIKLRPDGSFTFRFSLPDGRYSLPAVARSSDHLEQREARLEFSRSTEYQGQVEAHPQDESLRPPVRENLR